MNLLSRNHADGDAKICLFSDLPRHCGQLVHEGDPSKFLGGTTKYCENQPEGFIYYTCPMEGEYTLRPPEYFCHEHLEKYIEFYFVGEHIHMMKKVYGEFYVNKEQFLQRWNEKE